MAKYVNQQYLFCWNFSPHISMFYTEIGDDQESPMTEGI